MPKTDFIFIDESGDSGSGDGDSSKYYVELLLHVSDDVISEIIQHIVSWRYIRQYHREMKGLARKADIDAFLKPLCELKHNNSLYCSAIYLFKEEYIGPYLKESSPRGKEPIYFRNFIHRQLLEYHFSNYKPFTNNLELIFDRFEMTDKAKTNLEKYIKENPNLPTFRHITHANSLYSDFLQVASLMVNCVKNHILDDQRKDDSVLCELVETKDITNIQK